MARSDVIRADLERVRGMSAEQFADRWGEWARGLDKDLAAVQARWIRDLEHALPYAEQEDDAVQVLVDAKEAAVAYPSAETRARKDAAIAALQAIRTAERSRPNRQFIAGDAFVTGV